MSAPATNGHANGHANGHHHHHEKAAKAEFLTLRVNSPNVVYGKDEILSQYKYDNVHTEIVGKELVATPYQVEMTLKTESRVPLTG
jgi:hypothetical protein